MLKRTLSVVLCAMLMLGLLPFFTPAARMAPTTVNIVVDKTTAFVGDTLTYYMNVEGPNTYNVRILMNIDGVPQTPGNYGTSFTRTYVTKKAGAHVATATAIDLDDNVTLSSDSVTTQVKLRAKPQNLSVANVDGKSVKASWKAVAGVTGYKLMYKKASAANYTTSAYTTATSYTKGYLTPGIKYNFKVVGYNLVDGTKIVSTFDSDLKTIVTVGKATISTITSPSVGKVSLTWAKVNGATGYHVYRATSAGGTYAFVKGTTALSFSNTGLTSGKTYYYKVKPLARIFTTNYFGITSAYKAIKVK